MTKYILHESQGFWQLEALKSQIGYLQVYNFLHGNIPPVAHLSQGNNGCWILADKLVINRSNVLSIVDSTANKVPDYSICCRVVMDVCWGRGVLFSTVVVIMVDA